MLAFSAAEGKRAILNVVLHRYFLGSDKIEKRMQIDRNTEWQVEEIWSLSLKFLLIEIYYSFGPALSNQTKTAQEGGSQTENA